MSSIYIYCISGVRCSGHQVKSNMVAMEALSYGYVIITLLHWEFICSGSKMYFIITIYLPIGIYNFCVPDVCPKKLIMYVYIYVQYSNNTAVRWTCPVHSNLIRITHGITVLSMNKICEHDELHAPNRHTNEMCLYFPLVMVGGS